MQDNNFNQGGYYNYNYNQPPTPPKNSNNGFAIASMILGICSVICCFTWFLSILLGAAAIVLGIISSTRGPQDGSNNMAKEQSKRQFSTLAIVGIVVGSVGVAMGISIAVLEILITSNVNNMPINNMQ